MLQNLPEFHFLGLFAVTSGINTELYENIFESSEDDYSLIMVKAITDRLAEAFAEYMHDRIRQDLWGYQTEKLSNEAMIKEKYQGNKACSRISGLSRAHCEKRYL